MAKYDAVDRLMKMASDESQAGRAAGRDGERDAEAVLEAKVSSREPIPAGGVRTPLAAPPATGKPTFAEPAPAEPAIVERAISEPMSSVDRGRQLLGAIRPFLPAVGSALRLVDHGAVQAVARLLPMLGNLAAPAVRPAPQNAPVSSSPRIAEAVAASERQYTALTGELRELGTRVDTMEDSQRRLRELLERSVAEQGSLTHTLHQLADRSRLLSATVLILVMLVVAEMVLLGILLHR